MPRKAGGGRPLEWHLSLELMALELHDGEFGQKASNSQCTTSSAHDGLIRRGSRHFRSADVETRIERGGAMAGFPGFPPYALGHSRRSAPFLHAGRSSQARTNRGQAVADQGVHKGTWRR